MIIGCNGRGVSTKHPTPPLSWWDNKLGQPLGPPQTVNGTVMRSFASGTKVWYNLANKTGGVDGWEPPTPLSPPGPPPHPSPTPCPPLPVTCGKPLIDLGIGRYDLHSEETPGPGECCELCTRTTGCVSWAWHSERNNTCHTHAKGAQVSSTKHLGCISGFLNSTTEHIAK